MLIRDSFGIPYSYSISSWHRHFLSPSLLLRAISKIISVSHISRIYEPLLKIRFRVLVRMSRLVLKSLFCLPLWVMSCVVSGAPMDATPAFSSGESSNPPLETTSSYSGSENPTSQAPRSLSDLTSKTGKILIPVPVTLKAL